MTSSILPLGLAVDLGIEEREMTFQIALFGSDGLLVGSDKKIINQSVEVAGNKHTRDSQFSTGSKISRNSKGTIICFYAGGSESKSIADKVAVECNPAESNITEWHYHLRETARTVSAEPIGVPPLMNSVLVIRPLIPDIALISKYGDRTSVSPQIPDKICTGVQAKSYFLVEQFWRKIPVDRLKTLMLGALGYAAIERPESVGNGFDVLTIKDGITLPLETFEPDSPIVESAMHGLKIAIESALFPATDN